MRYAIDSMAVALPMHSGDWAAMTAEHAALALSRVWSGANTRIAGDRNRLPATLSDEDPVSAAMRGGCRTNRSVKWCINQPWDNNGRHHSGSRFLWDETPDCWPILHAYPTVACTTSFELFTRQPPSEAGVRSGR